MEFSYKKRIEFRKEEGGDEKKEKEKKGDSNTTVYQMKRKTKEDKG